MHGEHNWHGTSGQEDGFYRNAYLYVQHETVEVGKEKNWICGGDDLTQKMGVSSCLPLKQSLRHSHNDLFRCK